MHYSGDAGSSNSSSSHSEISRQTSTGSLLSPGPSTSPLADSAFDIFEHLNIDRHVVTSTIANRSTADVSLKFSTILPSSLVDAPSTVSLTREHNPSSEAGRASQELSDMPTVIPMEVDVGPSAGLLRTQISRSLVDAQLGRDIHSFSSSPTIWNSASASSYPACVQSSRNNLDNRFVQNVCGGDSNRTSAFKTWTAQALRSQSGEKKIDAPESLWRRWLRYVVPQMKFGAPRQPSPQIGTHHAMQAARMHMMAERTRRGKQNECFRALRTLTPNLRKKDKVTVLEQTIQYVQRLRKQVEELEEQNRKQQFESAGHQSPPTGEGIESPTERQTTDQIAAPVRNFPYKLHRMEVNYDAANGRSLFHIEIDVTTDTQANDTLINVLTALKQVKLASVQVDATYEENNFRAKLSALHEDDGNTIPQPDKLRALLRRVL